MNRVDDDIKILNRVLFVLLVGIPLSVFLTFTAIANAIANIARP